MQPKKIFIGGYAKSGTTFVGRVFGLFNNVYAKGELDYFRLFAKGLERLVVSYNQNIEIVNKEVYDGRGSLEPVTPNSFRQMHQKMFEHLFFAGQPVPEDCQAIVEKSPRNVFWIELIKKVFPDSTNVCVYRDPYPVFRSLIRHMADHRDEKFRDPAFKDRIEMLENFCDYWGTYITTVEKYRSLLTMVRYQKAADDNAGFVDFAEKQILGFSPGLKAPVESLSKENYLKSLPPELREKSLVQTGPYKIALSDEERNIIGDKCRTPDVTFDF